MSYNIERVQNFKDGSRLIIIERADNYIATLSKTKLNSCEIEYIWSYEANSLQSVMVWVNKTLIEPLNFKFFESGIFFLPHNNGFGNLTNKRLVLSE